jgi:hypothetical protein
MANTPCYYFMLSNESALHAGHFASREAAESLVGIDALEYGFSIFRQGADGTIQLIGSDGGEPEDQTLTRDWSWVVGALNEAYAQGITDGILKAGSRGRD